MDDNKEKQSNDQETSSEAVLERGQKAIEAAEKTAPTEKEKEPREQEKDAARWRNEG